MFRPRADAFAGFNSLVHTLDADILLGVLCAATVLLEALRAAGAPARAPHGPSCTIYLQQADPVTMDLCLLSPQLHMDMDMVCAHPFVDSSLPALHVWWEPHARVPCTSARARAPPHIPSLPTRLVAYAPPGCHRCWCSWVPGRCFFWRGIPVHPMSSGC